MCEYIHMKNDEIHRDKIAKDIQLELIANDKNSRLLENIRNLIISSKLYQARRYSPRIHRFDNIIIENVDGNEETLAYLCSYLRYSFTNDACHFFYNIDHIIESFINRQLVIFLVEDTDKHKIIAGFAVLKIHDNVADIILFEIFKNFRGFGIGKMSVFSLLAYLKHNQHCCVVQGHPLQNAIDFWRKMNFQISSDPNKSISMKFNISHSNFSAIE